MHTVENTNSLNQSSTEIDFWYVLPLAGQSNAMAYGEGLPLPDSLDRTDPRIKQLARRTSVTPGGERCHYNEIIPADHCLHDVQDMSSYNHPLAMLEKGEYGCVGQGLHIAKKLLPHIPDNAGILLVPCSRGGAAFTSGEIGTFHPSSGASSNSMRWGINMPLYLDLVSRTKAALDSNPRNQLLAVCWMQGEFDLMSENYQEQPRLFNSMVNAFRNDLQEYSTRCTSGDIYHVPWLCGDTTWYWKLEYQLPYACIYGNYMNQSRGRFTRDLHVYFISFQKDGERGLTNEPEEDLDNPSCGYLGAGWRSESNWTTSLRSSHFSTHARRGVIAERFAKAITELILQKHNHMK
ncbi:putative transposase [Citrobacter farmeri]|uniref:sialate O-acetylesterase n=1 Tax=Citrobacter farmeri TaxID=67824 RepID=UPI00209E38C7|nr:sialate O-acetylesterase [Citrobacter farmeri]MCP1694762.1 putative transposase [Citrobacter farmeri]MCW2424880.1 putative transposase [Citrobacter farmeri]